MSVRDVNIIIIMNRLVIDFTLAFKFCEQPNNNTIFTT